MEEMTERKYNKTTINSKFLIQLNDYITERHAW